MGWLGVARGLGDTGAQVGQGYDIAQNWRQREQQMAIEAARQKLADLMGPLQLEEIKQRIAAMNQPKYEGMYGTPGGGTSAAFWTPGQTGISSQVLTPGADKNSIKQRITAMAQTAPKEYQSAIQDIAESIDEGEDPLKALDKAQTLMGQAAGKQSSADQKTRFKLDMKNGIVSDKDGKEWSIYDPQLPDDLKQLVASAKKREGEEDAKKALDEANKFAQTTARMLQMADVREQQKAYDATLKVANRGVAGHSFLKTVQDQVARAGANGGQGTTSGDLLLIEGYMQLMFGVDPKALRGSPQMQAQLLKQGGVDDRVAAWFQNVRSGGKLDQSVRQEILDSSTGQVQAFDQAVRQTGELTDNAKVKDLVNRYNRAVGGTGQQQQTQGGGAAPPPGYVLDKPS